MALHILHITPSLGPGGSERQLTNLVVNSDPAEFAHTVCYLWPPEDFRDQILAAGHRVLRLNSRPVRPWLATTGKLVSLLRREQPDIIQTWLYQATITARLAMLSAPRVPLVTSLQSPEYAPDVVQMCKWPRIKVEAIRHLDRVSSRWYGTTFVAASQYVKQTAQLYLGVPPQRMHVIYNSFDAEGLHSRPEDRHRLRSELQLPPDSFIFLNVGRLDPQKGQAYLLRAFSAVLPAIPDAYLVIVGAGPLEAELKDLACTFKISRRVRFLGRRSDMGACYEMADVFVFPSLFEGFSIALLEAMHKGLPCIASGIGPILELIKGGETGILVPAASADSLADAMLSLYMDRDLRRSVAARGREEALRQFQTPLIIPQWQALYRQLARNNVNAQVQPV
jgi:glycosyltransferase involved in cell wall biosynthesis